MKILTELFGKPNKLSADWGVTSWTISGDVDNGWFIVDNENGTYSYTHRVWDESEQEYNYEDVITVEENNIKELIDFIMLENKKLIAKFLDKDYNESL